jgi:RNA polymerase sigma-70 factor (ECF subfamily)
MADQARFAEQAMPLLDSLYGGALQMTRSRPDAEALVQETYLRAYRAFGTFEDGADLKAWLYRILMSTSLGERRPRPHRAPETEIDRLEGDDTAHPFAGMTNDLHEIAHGRLREQLTDDAVTATLQSLPDEDRAAVLLADVESFSHEEIAHILDAEGQVKRAHRASSASSSDSAPSQVIEEIVNEVSRIGVTLALPRQVP